MEKGEGCTHYSKSKTKANPQNGNDNVRILLINMTKKKVSRANLAPLVWPRLTLATHKWG